MRGVFADRDRLLLEGHFLSHVQLVSDHSDKFAIGRPYAGQSLFAIYGENWYNNIVYD